MQRLLPVYRANPEAYDLSSIRRFWHLAAPCPPVIKQAWIDLLGPEMVWELYGGTELQALTFISGDQWLTHPGSVGVVVAGEMKVLDDDGNECPPGVERRDLHAARRRAARPPTATSVRPRRAATAGTRWATSATSTPTASSISTTAASTCSPSAAATCIRPRSSRRCPRIRMCCPAWSLACPMSDLGQVPYAIVQADGLDEAAVIAVPGRAASPDTRCRARSSSPTRHCATTRARPAARLSATRSSCDGSGALDRRSSGYGRSRVSPADARTREVLSDRLSSGGDRAPRILPAPQRVPARRLDQRIAHRRDREPEHQRQHQHRPACAR